MIRKIRLRGFKKFANQKFEIPGHLVVVGANDSGKTSLLQAVAAWMEIAFRWSQSNPDMAREEDGNYSTTNITVDSFSAVPLADFDHLWTGKKTQEPIAVWLDTERWNIGFEFLHKELELVAVRPARDVKEKALDALADDLGDRLEKSKRIWRPVYIPPVSGLKVKESRFSEEATLQDYLAGTDAGKVLRNLLWRVQENGHWGNLNQVVQEYFGYELTRPSSAAHILIQYRRSSKEAAYDLSSAAGGFLQVLLIYAAILGLPSAVYLIDEPDAHLHISLQNKLFRDLLEWAQRDKFQVIVATHSERLIREAKMSDLRLLDAHGNLQEIPHKSRVLVSLALDQLEIVEALRERRILYLEGPTDIQILRAWADTLGHHCLPFLERTTPIETAQREKAHSAVAHFYAMRALIPKVRGVELLDGDKKASASLASSERKSLLESLFWERKEIQSYLLHPDSVVRYLQSKTSSENAEKAHQYMKDNLRPKFFDHPSGELPFLGQFEIKDFFSKLFQEAGLLPPEDEDYLCMAERMKAEEIHSEVREKLDQIADRLELPAE